MSDLIDRQAAIDELIAMREHIDARMSVIGCTAYDMAIEALREPERATGKWIPCSERLPDTNGRYIVTRGLKACNAIWNRVYIINYSDLMGLKAEKIWWDGNVGKSDFQKIDDVIAWMPLPSPYKGEKE